MLESEFKDAIKFIRSYRELESQIVRISETFVREVSPPHLADHLGRSWRGRKKNFGDFYLNLSHSTQGNFLRAWGIEVYGLDGYNDAIRKNPLYHLSHEAPGTIKWLHELVKYFYNHGIMDTDNVQLPSLPGTKARYGNSMNWGRYILSLPEPYQFVLLGQIHASIVRRALNT